MIIQTPAGNEITIRKHGRKWRLVLDGRGHTEAGEYATKREALKESRDICQREQDEINALPGGGRG